MDVIRTVIVKLDVPATRRSDLHLTADQFRYCANETARWAWHDGAERCITSNQKAQQALYDRLREETDIVSNHVQKAIKRGIEAVRAGVRAWERGERTSRPTFDSWSVIYDIRAATFSRDSVSLATPNGRVVCSYVLPVNPEGTPMGEYLLNEAYEFRTSTLQYDEADDEFYLHVRLKRNYKGPSDSRRSDTRSENHTVLGVDVNLDGFFAVTSTARFIQSGGELQHRRHEFQKTRRACQQTGSRSAHLTLKQLSERERRWALDRLHQVSNEIVAEALDVGATHIAFEDLTGIRNRMGNANRFHAWAFRRVFELVEYKAVAEGLQVTQVAARNTSRRCSKCGHTERDNRPSKHVFRCRHCGYELNADYNAAKNIAWRYCEQLHSGQTSSSGGASSQYALASGMMTVTGEYSPTDSG